METHVNEKPKHALDPIRAATQQLHAAISDAAAKRGGDIKADLAAIPQKAKAAAESLKSSMSIQNEAAKKHLAEAVKHLEATSQHAAESLKTSGAAMNSAVKSALAEARAAAGKVSEAVAATRAAHPASKS